MLFSSGKGFESSREELIFMHLLSLGICLMNQSSTSNALEDFHVKNFCDEINPKMGHKLEKCAKISHNRRILKVGTKRHFLENAKTHTFSIRNEVKCSSENSNPLINPKTNFMPKIIFFLLKITNCGIVKPTAKILFILKNIETCQTLQWVT